MRPAPIYGLALTAMRTPRMVGGSASGTTGPSTLTQAIRKEYGTATVTEHSVGDWRRQNLAEVNGL